MKHSCWIVCAVAALVIGFTGLELLAQAADPLVGTWELNIAKSKSMSGPPPKSDTRTWTQAGDGFKFTRRGIDANGKPLSGEYTAKFDGKDYPITGFPDSDTISMRRIDQFISESIQRKAGKVVWVNIRVLSADGKVWTLASVSRNEKGEAVTNIQVFDKK
jgi:hypothetical protein